VCSRTVRAVRQGKVLSCRELSDHGQAAGIALESWRVRSLLCERVGFRNSSISCGLVEKSEDGVIPSNWSDARGMNQLRDMDVVLV
jgi:hypothetical protein